MDSSQFFVISNANWNDFIMWRSRFISIYI